MRDSSEASAPPVVVPPPAPRKRWKRRSVALLAVGCVCAAYLLVMVIMDFVVWPFVPASMIMTIAHESTHGPVPVADIPGDYVGNWQDGPRALRLNADGTYIMYERESGDWSSTKGLWTYDGEHELRLDEGWGGGINESIPLDRLMIDQSDNGFLLKTESIGSLRAQLMAPFTWTVTEISPRPPDW